MKTGIRVLVIDDEPGFRDLYSYVLEPLGYKVETAEDGEKGLEMALRNRYDMVFLDVHMPRLSGSQVLERIRQARPEQKVIVFSSSSDPACRFEEDAKTMGAVDCFYKPADLEVVLKTMKQALAGE